MGMEREQEFYENGNVIGMGTEWKWELMVMELEW